MTPRVRLFAQPLAVWERDGIRAALNGAGLPTFDVESPAVSCWRFDQDDVPVGFGGLEIHGRDALLRSLVTLPVLRGQGYGRAVVSMLEAEAELQGCGRVYLLAAAAPEFFARLGYRQCERSELPEPMRRNALFSALCPPDTIAMVKQLS